MHDGDMIMYNRNGLDELMLTVGYNLRLFLPVQYGTKPEGRLVPMTSSTTQAPRATAVTTAPTTTTNPVTAAPSTQPRGKSPLTTTTSTQGKTPTS